MRRKESWRALTPDQEDAVRELIAVGKARARDIASQYGVTVRTIYRVLARRHEQQVDVEIAGYRAAFVIDEDGPHQRTGWRAA